MSEIRSQAERQIAAPAATVYRALADYREQHFRFLPKAFSNYIVERGGYGAGTVVCFRTTMAGSARDFRAEVSEPVPGSVLQETDAERGTSTTFTITPTAAGCVVRIETAFAGAGGVAGLLERLFAPNMLRRLYREELDLLEQHVLSAAAAPSPPPAASVDG